jgi:AsmA protein
LSAVTGFKRLGIAICALILGVFGALALVSFLIPKDQVREAVKAEIRTATGLDPELRGDVSVALFPYGQVVLSDVSLGDGQAEPPLHVSRLTARLSFLPLLAGRIDIADLLLSDPRILITVDSEGKSNWAPLLKSLTRAFDTGREADDAPSFSEIRIDGGSVVVRDDSRKIYEYLSGADLSLAWPAISRSFAVTGSLRYRGETMEVGVTLGNFVAALQGERSALKVRIAGAPLKFTFDGAMATRPALKIEGATSADSSSLRRALQWIGKKPLPGGGFERFALKAQTNVVGGTLALSSVNLELDGNAAEGVLTFAADGRQTLQGTLAADALNLTPYLSTIRLLSTPDREWSRAPLDLDGLLTADLDLRLSAGKVTIGPTLFGRTAIATNLRNGNLGVTIGEARGFGGSLRGTIGLVRTEQGAVFTSQINFEDVSLEKSIGDLFGVNRIEGRGNIAVTLEGSGNSVYAITRTLNGEASLAGTKGALTGLNVEQLLRRLERRPLSGGNEFRSGRTPFETLNVQVKIAKGQATVEEVTMKSAGVQLEIAGAASIPARELDLKGVATLAAASGDRKPFELPFVVQGPWDDPLMLPDAQILIQRSGAAAPLLEALRGRNERDAKRPAAPSENAAPPATSARETEAAAPARAPQEGEAAPAPARAQEAAAPAMAPALAVERETVSKQPAEEPLAAPNGTPEQAPAAAAPVEKPEQKAD